MKLLTTPHGDLRLPAFMPDGTRAAVRTVDSHDVAACGIQCLMVNSMHLATSPGASLVQAMGGIHAFMGWRGPVASDSGGFQALSLSGGNKHKSRVSEEGISFREGGRKGTQLLTPEKCIQRQFQLGADIQFCLDHCTHPKDGRDKQEESVNNTLAWAKRCKEAFSTASAERPAAERPRLFAVVQGGGDEPLRRRCVEGLLEIGFDGFGFGGWPIDERGGLEEMVFAVAEMLPQGVPLHGLGIGKPENVIRAARVGYTLFDCVIPTRDARHRRLFIFGEPLDHGVAPAPDFYRTVNITEERYARDGAPLDPTCDCLACTAYSKAYLHHLFTINEQSGLRLATIHNLRFYARMMTALQSATNRTDGA